MRARSVLAAMNIQRYTILYIDFPKNVLAKDGSPHGHGLSDSIQNRGRGLDSLCVDLLCSEDSLLANPSVQDMEVLVVRLPDIDMRVPENYDTVRR
eukprot:1880757-Amphidinium_carterae.2